MMQCGDYKGVDENAYGFGLNKYALPEVFIKQGSASY